MCYVLPNLIPKLGSSKITVRRVTVQVMQTFTRVQPDALPSVLVFFFCTFFSFQLLFLKNFVVFSLTFLKQHLFFQKMIVNYVLTSPEKSVKHELLSELPALFQVPFLSLALHSENCASFFRLDLSSSGLKDHRNLFRF